ncbi:hypothetical protein L5515_007024 [Caenorhabditis briggsae]|uniref:Uncharacterized protein n=1 Tax=Caenorhabditis briggsae TaxID=6238 RepID=A0AAE9JLM5_CAEBR|nr:hypothetical protein L5515_007024 [Caenorhabditis briggsae]
MFINLAHFLIPKIFFILSYLANPIFVHLIHTEKSFHLGSYKYLLYFFAVFNMTASLADTLVPVCVHTHRYATMVFTVDGPFAERSRISEILVACRCAFISGTYGILNAHFIYRFLSLKYDKFVNHYFKPWGLVSAVFLVILHWVMWAVATDFAMGSVEESREYVRQSFEDFFNANMTNVNILVAVFSEVSPNVMYRSWFGNIFATVVSSYSIVLYFALGYKIMSYLTDGVSYLSPKTIQMQKRLFWALSIQTAIPICVSFMPCALALYGSAFRIDFGSFSNITASITVSTFPFLDPLAIICVYTYRYATVVFLTDGPFEERSRIGDFLVAARCAFISGTYGILNAHFLYRFMSLRYNYIILEFFNPYGLILSVYWVLIHWTLWMIVNDTLMTSDPELRDYVKIEFEQYYNVHIEDVNIKMVVFSVKSPTTLYIGPGLELFVKLSSRHIP